MKTTTKYQKKKKNTKLSLGKSQSILHKIDKYNMVPLKPTTKESRSTSHSITNRAPSSTPSSKRSVESASITHNYSDDMWINEEIVSTNI